MSGIFNKPEKPVLPVQEEVEKPEVVQEDEQEVKRRKRASMQQKGRQQNILAGIQNVLKQRLGE